VQQQRRRQPTPEELAAYLDADKAAELAELQAEVEAATAQAEALRAAVLSQEQAKQAAEAAAAAPLGIQSFQASPSSHSITSIRVHWPAERRGGALAFCPAS
jgi:hypothetical protein